MSNRMLKSLAIVLLGLAMLAFGGYYATESVVTCDEKIMQPGDTCRRPKQPTRTYEEQRSLDHAMGKVVFGAGVAVTTAGIVVVILSLRRRPESTQDAVPPGPPGPSGPPGGPGYYPPQQYPPGGQPHYPPPNYPPPSYPPPNYPPPNYPPRQ